MDSLINPSLFVVSGYPDIMPSQDQPPTSLSGGELKVVVAYLQSLGGKVTVRVTEKDTAQRKTETGMTSSEEKKRIQRGRDLFWNMECPECHRVGSEGGGERSNAPNLERIGAISPPDYIRISITKPAAQYVKGYEPGKVAEDMPKDYEARLSREEVGDLVAYLSGLKGPETAASPLKDYSPWILLFVGGAVLLMERIRWGRPRA
ncbi:MAG: cytochrome c [Armatimonadetes bacterium]|nr:cytochrome c [Armatimonadota bacterium]